MGKKLLNKNLKTNVIWSTNITKTGNKNIFICIINMYNIKIEILKKKWKTQ